MDFAQDHSLARFQSAPPRVRGRPDEEFPAVRKALVSIRAPPCEGATIR